MSTKEIPNDFLCLDTLIQTHGDVARLEKSVKKHEPLDDSFYLLERLSRTRYKISRRNLFNSCVRTVKRSLFNPIC